MEAEKVATLRWLEAPLRQEAWEVVRLAESSSSEPGFRTRAEKVVAPLASQPVELAGPRHDPTLYTQWVVPMTSSRFPPPPTPTEVRPLAVETVAAAAMDGIDLRRSSLM
mmetsp:Transcript_4247/g.11702  ORF Transcript_4247/g.11702 Transcript_4247/m.11702 type:complete len:110 (-) Transcript_4247:657-986(-)